MKEIYMVEYTHRNGKKSFLTKCKGGKYYITKGHAERRANRINSYNDPICKAEIVTLFVLTESELAQLVKREGL